MRIIKPPVDVLMKSWMPMQIDMSGTDSFLEVFHTGGKKAIGPDL
jgi:hypothetical protein